jgi:hypothetical protein
VSERLRRQTRNLLGIARAGSNPVFDVFASVNLHLFFLISSQIFHLPPKTSRDAQKNNGADFLNKPLTSFRAGTKLSVCCINSTQLETRSPALQPSLARSSCSLPTVHQPQKSSLTESPLETSALTCGNRFRSLLFVFAPYFLLDIEFTIG